MANSSRISGLLSRKLLLGATVGAALFFMVVGVIFWGGFNTAMEATNTLEFCISCHEMEENVYKEYTKTVHYANRSGVRATCSDCHVPDPWVHKFVRKVRATNEPSTLCHSSLVARTLRTNLCTQGSGTWQSEQVARTPLRLA